MHTKSYKHLHQLVVDGDVDVALVGSSHSLHPKECIPVHTRNTDPKGSTSHSFLHRVEGEEADGGDGGDVSYGDGDEHHIHQEGQPLQSCKVEDFRLSLHILPRLHNTRARGSTLNMCAPLLFPNTQYNKEDEDNDGYNDDAYDDVN